MRWFVGVLLTLVAALSSSDALLTGSVYNMSSIEEIRLVADDVVPPGVMLCNKGRSEIRVLVGISLCFSDAEITAILLELDTGVSRASTFPFYFNSMLIQRAFAYGAYVDGTCTAANRRLPIVVFDNLRPQDKFTLTYDLYINVAKNSGRSFSVSLAKTKFKIDRTIDVRICTGAQCPAVTVPASSDVVVPTISRFCDASDAILTAMYCADLKGAYPFTYTSYQRKLQCGCTCPASKVATTNGACVCPGDLVPDATGQQCVCPGGRTPTQDNLCVCSGGRVLVDGACVCPSGSRLDGGVCVTNCVWSGGSLCSWRSAAPTLKLKDDCALDAPAPKGQATVVMLSQPTAGAMIAVAASKRGAIGSGQQCKATASWASYTQTPGGLENQIVLSSMGVHDLSLAVTTTDNRYNAKCVGCVAVVDAFPPTPEKPCTTTDDRTTPTMFSVQALASTMAAEASFTSFYSSENIKNNGEETADGDNKRCDETAGFVTDFFESSPRPLASLDTKCFPGTYLSDLLSNTKTTITGDPVWVSSLDSDASTTSALVCERCCSKTITLKEIVRKYDCIKSGGWDWAMQGTSGGAFGRCLRVQPEDLIVATSDVSPTQKLKTKATIEALAEGTTVDTSANVIHRSLTCTTFAQGCKSEPTLGELLTKAVAWNPAANVPSGFRASDYVVWRYKTGGAAAWKTWQDSETLTLTDPLTFLLVQAWTRCGRVHEATYRIKLHPHSPRDVCNNFGQRWFDNSPAARKVDGNICAFPGSDFALVSFKYDSFDHVNQALDTVTGKYTNVQCFVAVAEEGSLAKSSEAPLSLEWANRTGSDGRISISKEFALELVNRPRTAANTDAQVRCAFTYQYFDSSKAETESCLLSFRLTDCDAPTVGSPSLTAACLLDQCSMPVGLPGAFEACSGNVFAVSTAGSTASTVLKPLSGSCCTACDRTLVCTPLAATTGGVKRCESTAPPSSFGLVSLTKNAAASMTYPSPSTAALALLVSAMVMAVVVGLLAVKMQVDRANSNQLTSIDSEAYVQLE
jgi:hypothetical protein